MNKLSRNFKAILTMMLTGVIMIMPLFTCFYILHQPQMPEELNDFRKYDK